MLTLARNTGAVMVRTENAEGRNGNLSEAVGRGDFNPSQISHPPLCFLKLDSPMSAFNDQQGSG
ncbi:MAG TPA: hypothetical protein VIK56_07780 [Rhodoferax sp.]